MEVSMLYDVPYHQNAIFKATSPPDNKANELVTMLLKENCKADFVDALKQIPLHYAAKDGKVKTLKTLVEAGCNVNHVDTYGQTPLFYIAKNNHVQAANLMVELGADPDLIDHNL
jgi:ankyrin repeat protein